MRIEKVDENKIKVLIEDNEARQWNISFQSLCENTPQMRRVFQTAVALAEENIDFSVDGAKLFVEAIHSEAPYDFGMLITRVCNEGELKRAVRSCSYQGRLRKTRMEITKRNRCQRVIYRFIEFENACRAVSEMAGRYHGESRLYKYQGSFYLLLELSCRDSVKDMEAVLGEFGHVVQNGQYMHGRLNEYGKVMIPRNAFGVMEEYFCVR